MDINVFADKQQMGSEAAVHGAGLIREALNKRGSANIILATGASQFEMLAHLALEPDIDWYRVTAFHLDEYVGLPISHGASFRSYLWGRFFSQLPSPMRAVHYLNGEGDGQAECVRVGEILRQHPIDVAFVGIGENGHLAFNDPPADFLAEEAYRVVELDDRCRIQQYNEGWFDNLHYVPRHALSMTVPKIMESRAIVCTVPDERKAAAVRYTLDGDVTPQLPASILQHHPSVSFYLDEPAAAFLSSRSLA